MDKKRGRSFFGILLLSILIGCWYSPVLADVITNSFPAEYHQEEGSVSIHCSVEVPDSVSPDAFYAVEVEGYRCVDYDKAYALLAGDRKVEAKHEGRGRDGGRLDNYTFEDKSSLTLGTSIIFATGTFKWYNQNDTYHADGGKEEELTVTSREESESILEDIVGDLGISLDDFQIQWISLNSEQLRELQQENIRVQLLEEQYRKENISSEDEIYFFYSRQYNQGLPVLHEMMMAYKMALFDDITNNTFMAYVSGRGLECLRIECVYDFRETGDVLSFADFSSVAQTVCDKYNMIITENVYTFDRAVLFQRVWNSSVGQLSAQPVWRFTGQDQEGTPVVVLVDAVTAEEIYVN